MRRTGAGERLSGLRGLFGLLLMLTGPMAAGAGSELAVGHFDLAIDYELGGVGWHAYLYDRGAEREWKPEEVILRLTEASLGTVPSGAGFGFLGKAGAPVWILSEVYNAGQLYLGFGAPLLGRDIFTGGLSNRGQVSIRMLGVSGSGVDGGGAMHMWVSGFPPTVVFSSDTGVGAPNQLDGIVANFHAHYNFGFSGPGIYRVRFEVRGTLRAEHGGGETRYEFEYTFAVGSDAELGGVLRYATEVDEHWQALDWLGRFHWAEGGWIYIAGRGWATGPDGDWEGFWQWDPAHGWLWSTRAIYPWAWSAQSAQWQTF